MPDRRQAITWTNDDQFNYVYLRRQASMGRMYGGRGYILMRYGFAQWSHDISDNKQEKVETTPMENDNTLYLE